MNPKAIILAAAAVVFLSTQSEAKHRHHYNHHHTSTISVSNSSSLVTVPTAAGISIKVHPVYAAKFQNLIARLVAEGHKPRFITCYARGHKSGSNHAWGGACDIDQTAWGRTSAFMYHANGAIHAAGLYSGGDFGDWGHVEAMKGLHNHPPNLYASIEKFKSQQSTANYQP